MPTERHDTPQSPPPGGPGARATPAAASLAPPEWARHAVWYQVLLDRFRNGSPDNDPPRLRPWTSAWFTPLPAEGRSRRVFYRAAFRRNYGGDLDGLEQKLPYLLDLGVNALYLNPVFEAATFHGYNATSYIHVADRFGVKGSYQRVAAQEDLTDPDTWQWSDSDRRFLRFLRTAHAMGFHVIIDGVFNHVGIQHPAFRDVMQKRAASRYAAWFDVRVWAPLKYKGWWDHPELPVFKKGPAGFACAEVKQHIFAITRRWLAPDGDPGAGVDGWRLDVPNEIPLPFWTEWCPFVKSVKPEAYITGEIWDRADQWLDGRSFDAVMNYQFARAVVAWVFDRKSKISAGELDRRLAKLRQAYTTATPVLQNLLDSHDTDRVASMAQNPDRPYNKLNQPHRDAPHYNDHKPSPESYARARLAALIQMTYIGAPMIYYGDEVGMWGAADPTCRKPMLWEDLQPYEQPEENHVMAEHLDYYRRIIALRNAHPALRSDTFQTLLCDDAADVWAFRRADQGEQLIVALNAAEQPRHVSIPLPAGSPPQWQVIFGPPGSIETTGGKLAIEVPPVAGLVLHAPQAP